MNRDDGGDDDDEAVHAAERKAEGVRELVRARGGKPDKTGKRSDREVERENGDVEED